MTTIRYVFWALIALALVSVGIANRGPVTLRAMPEALAAPLGISPDVTLPLFIVIFLGFAAGLLVGFVWEWIREYNQRAEARAQARELAALRRELDAVRKSGQPGKDEVLALLDTPPAR